MPVRATIAALLLLATGATGCRVSSDDAAPDAASDGASADADTIRVTFLGDDSVPSDTAVAAARYAGRGRAGLRLDTAAIAAAQRSFRETDASLDSVTAAATGIRVPVGGNVAGQTVLKVQILLDRAGFSPGEMDGRWGDNTEMAVAWFQQSAELPTTGVVDQATLAALVGRAGRPDSLLTTYALTEDDLDGPFETIPGDVYAQAEMDRLSYESLAEYLGEKFHASPALLQRLNRGRDFAALAAGDTLRVPNLAGAPRGGGGVSRLVVSGREGYLHALAADGRVLFHAPVTLGSQYNPSPDGDLRITGVARNPSWHYQPALLTGGDPDAPTAIVPPGPNNAVGTVWMALSQKHMGIHGTKAPATIGTAASSGCVRLTNWDAERLAGMVRAGTPVRFRDIVGRESGRDSTAATRTAAR